MSTDLHDAVNMIIGAPGVASGLRYAVNHSITSAPGATAPHQLTIPNKVEARPILFMDDPTNHYPGVFFETVGDFPSVENRGDHAEALFTVIVYYVGATAAGDRPREAGRLKACQLLENIMATNKLELTFVDGVFWLGHVADPFTQDLHLILPDYYACGTRVQIVCRGVTY